MAALSLTPSRALQRPRRLDRRVVIGLFLVAATLGGSIAAWNGATSGHDVLAVSRALPTGTVLTAGDLTAVSIRVDDDVLASLMPASSEATAIGRSLSEAVPAHALLARAAIATQPPLGPGEMELTIPVTPQTALDGQLQPGDSVALLWTQGKGTPQSKTTVLIDRALVRSVGYDTSTAAINASPADGSPSHGAINAVTLVLTSEQAVAVAQARWNGDLDVARVRASATVSTTAPGAEGEAAR